MGKNKDSFSMWFDAESGYSLHRGHIPTRKLVYSCCGREPEKTALEAAVQNSINTGENKSLYCCPVCKRWFFMEKSGYYPAGSLLQYQITEVGETDASH